MFDPTDYINKENLEKSTKFVYQDGLKYRNKELLMYPLFYDYGLQKDFIHPDGYYAVIKDHDGCWWLLIFPECCWDGATFYWDYQWMMLASLVHDILHWLIKRGIIDEKYNFLIDKELQHLVLTSNIKIPWYQGGEMSKPFRAWIIKTGTALANEKRANAPDLPITVLDI